jgi:hypothetical protein
MKSRNLNNTPLQVGVKISYRFNLFENYKNTWLKQDKVEVIWATENML